MVKVLVGALAAVTMSFVSAGPAWAAGEACSTSQQCTADPNAPICDSLLGGGCPSGTCSNKCRKCTTGLECTARNPSTTICELDDAGARAGQCVGCISSSQCQGPTPVCDVGSATCVGCLGSGDCQSSGNPVCNQANHQCVSCGNDFEPNNPGLFACSNPNLPACQKTNEATQQGACTQCSSTNPGVCPNQPNAPKCTVAKGACGCQSDPDCGAKTGRICDPSQNNGAGLCVVGCRVVGGVDNCPRGLTCSAQDGGIGVCASPNCNGDSDCAGASPRVHCNTTLHQCVECIDDSQCTGGKVCETDSTNPKAGECVECTPLKDNNCAPEKTGDRCLASSDTCGCVNDGDCGGPTSGRVCDDGSSGGDAGAATHQCIPGCRGQGGNGCPEVSICSSTDHSVGVCNPKNGGDAGDGGGNGDGGDNGDGGVLDQLFPRGAIIEGGGCGCSTVGNGPGTGVAFGLGAAFALTGVLRRRRRRRS